MDNLIKSSIVEILTNNKELLQIPIRQKAKFEGWLKFELANHLEMKGMELVEVESKPFFSRNRTDITFFSQDNLYSIELKTPNTNWHIDGVSNNCRPITKNIQSIIDDAIKLNSNQGIVAFVLFPIPLNDNRWQEYIIRIKEELKINIDFNKNCSLVEMNVNSSSKCNVLVCAFISKYFRN